MDEPDFHALARSAAGFLALRIDPMLLDAVAANLALLHGHAERVMVPLAAEEASARGFRP